MTTFMIMTIRSHQRCLVNVCNQNVIFTSQSYSSSSRNNNVSVNPVDIKLKSAPKASKYQIRTIKKLYKENKALFGVLLESKQEKVKRTRKESKLIKQLSSTSQVKRSCLDKKTLASSADNESSEIVNDDEVDRTLGLILQDEIKRKNGMNFFKPGSLPRASSVRLEHAGMSINKNRIKVDAVQDSSVMGKSSPVTVRAHKGAEIEWAMRNAPTKIKLIELSSSVTTDDESDNAHQSLDELGHRSAPTRTSLPIEDDERKRVRTTTPSPSPSSSQSSSSCNSNDPHNLRDSLVRKSTYLSPAAATEEQEANSLPTVEQLINSFYETGNGQLRPHSETRKMVLSATNSSSDSSSKNKHEVVDHAHHHYVKNNVQDENLGGGMDFNEHPKKNKIDNDGDPVQIPSSEKASRSNCFLPYYNPDRNITNAANDCIENNDAGGGDYEKSAESTNTIITSFPFPFSHSTKDSTNNDHETTEASKTPASSTSPLSNNDATGALLVNNGLNLNAENDTSEENKVIIKSESLLLPLASVKLPSVSRILNATMPKAQAEALRRWEHKMIAQMGVEGFRLYKEGILTNGKSLHSNIESYLRGTPPDELHIAEPNQGHWNSLNAVLASVDHVHVLESHVIHPKLQYCGVIDCVAEFRNRLVLIDWKTSQKPKPFVSMTYDTPLQIAAYIGAINYDERYSLKIDDGMIVVAYEDGSSCQTFLLSSMDVEKYWKLWLNRLQLFRKMNPSL